MVNNDTIVLIYNDKCKNLDKIINELKRYNIEVRTLKVNDNFMDEDKLPAIFSKEGEFYGLKAIHFFLKLRSSNLSL